MKKTLLSFGHGYSAQALDRVLIPQGWRIYGTTRSDENKAELEARGVIPLLWGSDAVKAALEECSHILISTGPKDAGDPVLALYRDIIARRAGDLEWVGYLSTTGVYGHHDGGWVTEDAPLIPATPRGMSRKNAEQAWGSISGLPLHIFRLAGIYGPGRGPFEKVRTGKARRIIKKGQVFSRIHVDDIAQVLAASIAQPNPGRAYNVCDNDPAPPQDVIAYAAELLGMPLPPAIKFEEADMTPMARSFYAESKRVDNTRIKQELGVELAYPDYRAGLQKSLSVEDPRSSVLSFLERYNNAFYARDIAALKDCYTADHVRFWDNHAGNDSDDLPDHLTSVQAFFTNGKATESGTVEKLEIENPQVWFHGDTATLAATLRYASHPKPGVRSTFCLKLEKGSWRAFHVHHSFDPNEA